MKTKYTLSNEDLHLIFGTRIAQVKGGLTWLYQPNDSFPDKMSPKRRADSTGLSIEIFEKAFAKRFGNIEPEIVDYHLSDAKKAAVLERYPNARIVSFKDKYGHSPTWFRFNRLKDKVCEPSVTSFGDNVIRPRWRSALSDILCVVTLGIMSPKRRAEEKCLGDLDLDPTKS